MNEQNFYRPEALVNNPLEEGKERFPVKPNTESIVTQSIKRAEKITPVEVIQIKENPDIEASNRRVCSAANLFLDKGDSYDVKPRLSSSFEVKGKAIKLKLKLDGTPPNIAGYEPSIDTYLIGRKGLEHCKNNRELFFYDVNHEVAHDEYLSLGLNEQRALNDLFIQDKTLNEFIRKFATALYTDKVVSKDKSGKLVGDKYLRVHDMSTPEIATHMSTSDQKKGIKDTRSMEILVNDQKRDILFGALATEFVSFLSACERGEEAFNEVATSYRDERNGEDPRFDVIRATYDHLMKSPELKKEFDKYGLYRNNNSEFLESFVKETKNIERWLFV